MELVQARKLLAAYLEAEDPRSTCTCSVSSDRLSF